MKRSYFSAKYLLPSLMVLGLLLRSSTCTKDSTVYEANGKVNVKGWTSPQVWLLTNVQSGDVATVVVQPFTNSGTFEETSSSDGWWMPLPCATGRERIPVRVTITRTTSGARWTFDSINFSCGSWTVTGNSDGNSSSNIPTATSVSGYIQLNQHDGNGTTYRGGNTWTGVKK